MDKFWGFRSFKNAAGEEETELRIEGEIVSNDDVWLYEWFDIDHTSPNAFRDELAQHAGKNITVWIDSWGGDVFAGVGIYNALKEHSGRVTVKVDGKAVSAGSVIAMAGDETLMSPGSVMMIHNVWGLVIGEAKDLRHQADVYDEIKEGLINIYRIRTGLSRSKISRMMDEETWMSAKKAIAEGFADRMLYVDENPDTDPVPVQNAFSLSRLAIQNSANHVMKRFFEQYKKMQPQASQKPSDERFFNLQRKKLDLISKL